MNAEREEEHERERGQHDDPLQGRAEDRLSRWPGSRRPGRPQPGQHEPEPHVVVDPQHVLAQALVEEADPTGAVRVCQAKGVFMG